MEQKLSRETKFRMNGKKLKMAELLANPEFTGTNKEIQEQLGISANKFYAWIKEPEMIAYIQELVERYTDGEICAVWGALVEKCKKGDVPAIKLYFELKSKRAASVAEAESGGVIILPQIDSCGSDE